MRGFYRLTLCALLGVLACNRNHVRAIELSNEAMMLHDRNLNAQAIERLNEAIRLEPDCDICHHNLATIYLATEAWSDASTHYERAAELTGDANDWTKLGYVLMRHALQLAASKDASEQSRVTEQLKRAEEALKKAIEADPEDYSPYYYLGQVYREEDRFEEAGQMFRKCIELNPTFADAFNEYGMLFSDLDMLAEAEQVFKEGLRINPQSGNLHNQLGSVYKAKKRYEEAIAEFSEAIKDKDVPEAYFNLGVAYFEKGGTQEKKDAEYYLNEFLKSSSRNETMKSQARIILSDLHNDTSNP